MEHTVESLVDLSNKRKFVIDDINWSLGVDFDKKWMPESLNPLNYLPSFHKVPKDEQLRLNQFYASGICEKFIFFESSLCVALEALLKNPKKLPEDLIPLMLVFHEEESKHSAMFQKLQNTAFPEKYKGGESYFLGHNFRQRFVNRLVFKNPEFFLFWIWLGAYFEEKTVVFSQEYIRERKLLDPLFVQVHKFHLQDEARHVEIDRHFFKEFFDKGSSTKKKLAVGMFRKTLKSIEVPNRTVGKIFDEILKDKEVSDPGLYTKLLKEVDLLAYNMDYKRALFGRKRFPVFQSILGNYPDFALINEHFCE